MSNAINDVAYSTDTSFPGLSFGRFTVQGSNNIQPAGYMRVVIGTRSTSPIIVGALSESNCGGPGTVIYCGYRTIDFGEGPMSYIMVTIFPAAGTQFPSDVLFMFTLMQVGEHADFGAPTPYGGL